MKKGAIFTEEHKRNLSLSHKGQVAWNKGHIFRKLKECESCATQFRGEKKRKFCSRSCAKKGNKNMLGKHRKYSEETLRKMSESHKGRMTGEKHYRWIADRSLLKNHRLKAYDCRYKEWMLKVKRRDGWKCKISNDACDGRLEAHHILRWNDFPELRYDVNNGITLCRFHHPLKVEEESKLVPVFQRIINTYA